MSRPSWLATLSIVGVLACGGCKPDESAAPTDLRYGTNPAIYTRGIPIAASTPSHAGGAVASYAVAPGLPDGLALAPTTGVISGTPAGLAPARDYTVTASNEAGSATAVVSITVVDQAPASLAYGFTAVAFTMGAPIAPRAPTASGGAVVAYAIAPALPAGLNLDAATGVISGTPAELTAARAFTVTASNTGGSATTMVSLAVVDRPPADLAYPFTSAAFPVGVAVAPRAPSSSGGAVVSYAVAPPLPVGLSLDAATGVLAGTPAVLTPAGAYTVTATNSGGSVTTVWTLEVTDPAPAGLVYGYAEATFRVGMAIPIDTPTSQGGAVAAYAVDPPLPAGLAIDPATGSISGTPSGPAATASYTVKATNRGGSASAVLTFTVLPAVYTLRGSVPGAAAVPIRVTGAEERTTSTDAGGAFAVTGLPAGEYVVAPTEVGFVFAPNIATVTIVAADLTVAPFTRSAAGEGLPPSVDDALATEPPTYLAPDEIIMPNGTRLSDALLKSIRPLTGPQEKKNQVLASMLADAYRYACGHAASGRCTTWDYTMPAQLGLAYVFGGKDPLHPMSGADSCTEKLHGMDCSGLIYNLAGAAGMTVPTGQAIDQENPDAWVIPEDWKLEMKLVTDGSIESGDILGWPGHIGIAAVSGSKQTVISSAGGPNRCTTNKDAKHGPIAYTVGGLGLGEPTRVLRLVTTLSGDFDFYIRCAEQSTDAAVIHFEIDNDDGGPFHATGSGTDYDGTPLSFVLDGTYDQAANEVDATLALVDGSRSDAFTERLSFDDTGYFPLRKVVDNGGCEAAGRLVRVEASELGGAPSAKLPRAAAGVTFHR